MREMIRVREADQELRVQVLDGRAYVAIMAADEPEVTEEWTRAVSLPARRLHALLRAAWADDQYGSVGPIDPPLWPPDEPQDGPEPEEDPYRQERVRFGWRDDWPGGRPGGPGEVLPFRNPVARVRPARCGQPWRAEEETALRQGWLDADPSRPRWSVLDDLAAQLGRTADAVAIRLQRVGCTPSDRGSARAAARPGADEQGPARGSAVPDAPAQA
jgi:hypothetical protein